MDLEILQNLVAAGQSINCVGRRLVVEFGSKQQSSIRKRNFAVLVIVWASSSSSVLWPFFFQSLTLFPSPSDSSSSSDPWPFFLRSCPPLPSPSLNPSLSRQFVFSLATRFSLYQGISSIRASSPTSPSASLSTALNLLNNNFSNNLPKSGTGEEFDAEMEEIELEGEEDENGNDDNSIKGNGGRTRTKG